MAQENLRYAQEIERHEKAEFLAKKVPKNDQKSLKMPFFFQKPHKNAYFLLKNAIFRGKIPNF